MCLKCPPPRTHACIGMSLAYTSDVQQYRHGVRRSFKNFSAHSYFVEPGVKINVAYYRDVHYRDVLLMYKLFYRAEGENKRCLLSRSYFIELGVKINVAYYREVIL